MLLSEGYQYSKVFCNVCSIYLCAGDHIEDITTHLGQDLMLRLNARVASSDTIGRVLKSFACENTKYTSYNGATYEYNETDNMNKLLLDLLMATGQLKADMEVTLDFDHELISTEKREVYEKYESRKPVEINFEQLEVASFEFTDFILEAGFRLVV